MDDQIARAHAATDLPSLVRRGAHDRERLQRRQMHAQPALAVDAKARRPRHALLEDVRRCRVVDKPGRERGEALNRVPPLVLHSRETPRVRVVLDVRPGSDGGKVVMLAPDATDGERSFLASRVATLAWDLGTTSAAAAG